MEQAKAIHPGLAIWVTEGELLSTSVWRVDGVALDGYHGFGTPTNRCFQGNVVLLAPKERTVQYLSISSAHFSHFGFKWIIKQMEFLPEIPFLIAENSSIEMFWKGYVDIDKTSDIIDRNQEDVNYSVAAKNWFGILTVKEKKCLYLRAFSLDKNATLLKNEEIWSFEWDCLLGRLKLV